MMLDGGLFSEAQFPYSDGLLSEEQSAKKRIGILGCSTVTVCSIIIVVIVVPLRPPTSKERKVDIRRSLIKTQLFDT